MHTRNKIYILFILQLFSINSFSQFNLIPNPGFENYSVCPDFASQLELCTNWFSPTLSTPDFFHECAGQGTVVSIPNNALGSQFPFSGQGYVGLFSETLEPGSQDPTWYTEYICTKLNYPLKSQKTYEFAMNVSRAENFKFASQFLGAYFSQDKPFNSNTVQLFNSPQIVNDNGFIVDSDGWTEIAGEFIAEGGEEYVTIGLFHNSIDTLFIGDSLKPASGQTYYYIDGVSVLERHSNNVISFSPNSDGINDVIDFTESNLNTIKIFNRWGKLVFDCRQLNCIWDGKLNNQELPNGTYFYFATESNSNTTIKGIIHLFN